MTDLVASVSIGILMSLVAVSPTATASVAEELLGGGWIAASQEDTVEAEARTYDDGYSGAASSSSSYFGSPAGARPSCSANYRYDVARAGCVPDQGLPVMCDAVDEFSGLFGACPGGGLPVQQDEEGEAIDLDALIAQEFARLVVAPPVIVHQPDGDWAAVGMDFIVFTDTEAQLLTTELLGFGLTFRLTPVHWTWDFGDGSPARPSSTPGTPYPHQTIAHVYSEAHDGVTLTLTTTWMAHVQVSGHPTWFPVDGVATTTATAGPVEIVAFRVGLVDVDVARGDR